MSDRPDRAHRVDAYAKASGAERFTADLSEPDELWIAVVRSPYPRAGIVGIDTGTAATVDGVVAFLDGRDFRGRRYGRGVRDLPVLAEDEVRYVGEPVVAVLADSRESAELAVELVEIEYETADAVLAGAATEPGSALVHPDAAGYEGADPAAAGNLQARLRNGDAVEAKRALDAAAHVVSHTYTVGSVHQGYLEPHACIARTDDSGAVHLWVTNKSPYLLRHQTAVCLDLPVERIIVHPVPIGGDFGGKGSPVNAVLCVAAALRFGRPTRMVMRYNEELIAGQPRHPTGITLTIGADDRGTIAGVLVEAWLDGGAYGGLKPWPASVAQGLLHCLHGYRIPALYSDVRVLYTNTVPRGHVRGPGHPQGVFALESAIDELAGRLALDPIEFRRRNLVGGRGSDRPVGAALLERVASSWTVAEPPWVEEGRWRVGRGIAVELRAGSTLAEPGLLQMLTSELRLRTDDGGRTVEVQTSTVETGTGSLTALRNLLAAELDLDPAAIRVRPAGTADLASGIPPSGSLVTAALAGAARLAADAWRARDGATEIVVHHVPGRGGSYELPGGATVQEATVAVDVETGQIRVLRMSTWLEVGRIVNPKAHQMQIDGGTVMGLGLALTEDLSEADGQVGSAHLGDYKIPTARDLPELTTTLVIGDDPERLLSVGESTNTPTAAAIGNALADAVGIRIRDLPFTAEKVYNALRRYDSGAPE